MLIVWMRFGGVGFMIGEGKKRILKKVQHSKKRSKNTNGFKACLFIRILQNDMHIISKQQINRHHKKK